MNEWTDGFIRPAIFHPRVLPWFRITVQLLDWLMLKPSLVALGYVAISYIHIESAKRYPPSVSRSGSTSSTPPIPRKHRKEETAGPHAPMSARRSKDSRAEIAETVRPVQFYSLLVPALLTYICGVYMCR